jgi:hypothetical protein
MSRNISRCLAASRGVSRNRRRRAPIPLTRHVATCRDLCRPTPRPQIRREVQHHRPQRQPVLSLSKGQPCAEVPRPPGRSGAIQLSKSVVVPAPAAARGRATARQPTHSFTKRTSNCQAKNSAHPPRRRLTPAPAEGSARTFWGDSRGGGRTAGSGVSSAVQPAGRISGHLAAPTKVPDALMQSIADAPAGAIET